MTHHDREPRKNLARKVFDAITRRGRETLRIASPEIRQFERAAREDWMRRQARASALQEQAQLAEQQRTQRETRAEKLLEEKKRREAERGRQTHLALEKELKKREIDKQAEIIRRYTWNNIYDVHISSREGKVFESKYAWEHIYQQKSYNPNIALASEKDDGTFIDGSQAGRELSYNYVDVGEYQITWYEFSDSPTSGPELVSSSQSPGHLKETIRRSLSFGIGYFTDRAYIIDEAQGLISDDEVAKGVKAYFIHRRDNFSVGGSVAMEVGERIDKRSVGEIERYIIPVDYPESFSIFERALDKIAYDYAPDTVVPQANERIQRIFGRRD